VSISYNDFCQMRLSGMTFSGQTQMVQKECRQLHL
jgi:hypothetical protein